jgi:hypothetical protein
MVADGEVVDAEFETTETAVAQVVAPTALEAITRGEMLTQVDVAKRYPRSLAHFKQSMLSLATSSKAIAEKCFYTLPGRKGGDGKPLSGPSVRMAEIMAASWGNLMVATSLVDIADETVTVKARVWDMEKNVAHAEEFVAPIVGSERNGRRRFSDEMIGTTIRAAQAKARRNAILAVVPRAYYEEIKAKIMQVAAGEVKDMKSAWAGAVKWWGETYQVSELQLLKALKRQTADEANAEDLAFLRGFVTSIKQGDITVEQLFGPAITTTDNLVEKLKAREAQQAPAREEPGATEPDEEPAPAAEPKKGKKN